MAVERSDKLKWQVYEPSIAEAPYLVYYMIQSSDNYTSSGYSFNIKTPALGAFLDPEVYLRYKIRIKAKSAGNIQALFGGTNSVFIDPNSYPNTSTTVTPNNAGNNLIDNGIIIGAGGTGVEPATGNPGAIKRIAFRQGNVMQRCTQQIVLTVNGFTLNAEPWKWIDPMNRLMVSKEQSKHVFSGSGGEFDSGNHGLRNSLDNIAQYIQSDRKIEVADSGQDSTTVPLNDNTFGVNDVWNNGLNKYYYDGVFGGATFGGATGAFPLADRNLNMIISEGFNVRVAAPIMGRRIDANDLTYAETGVINLNDHSYHLGFGGTFLYKYPKHELFYNPGFSNRIYDLLRKFRGTIVGDSFSTGNGVSANCSVQNNALYFAEDNDGFDLYVYEPVPLPPFKMWHNDGVGGIIPHVRDMTLRATFTANLLANMFMANYNVDSSNTLDKYGGFSIDFSSITSSDCQIHMQWYLPPPSITIPREISIPLRKYDMYISSTSNSAFNTSLSVVNNYSTNWQFQQYNISLDAVPDLLMIYVRYKNDTVRTNIPCDMHFELVSLTLQLENNGGKLNQITTFKMYQNWLKYIKFDDPPEMTFDEWRKYCCVAVLKPDDYGIIRGPGWDNVVVLGVQGTARNHWNNPSINMVGNESFFNLAITQQEIELVVLSIYDRWHLTLSADGTARANLTRIRDLGNPLPPTA